MELTDCLKTDFCSCWRVAVVSDLISREDAGARAMAGWAMDSARGLIADISEPKSKNEKSPTHGFLHMWGLRLPECVC